MKTFNIPIVLLEDYLSFGVKTYYTWSPQANPHLLLYGSSGSGKTYASTLIIAKITKFVPQATIYICDFKCDDNFSYLEGIQRFYRFEDCYTGVQDFYNCFDARRKNLDLSRSPQFLFFDELAAAVIYLDKKKAEEFRSKIATLLMLGRSFNCFLIIAMQRPDANHIPARENISLVIALSNLSEEAKEMFFHNFKSDILPDRSRGRGYMLEGGANLSKIVVPTVHDKKALEKAIINHLTAQGGRRQSLGAN